MVVTNNAESILIQVVARYCQATNHYLNHCWPIYLLLYGVTRGNLSTLLFVDSAFIAIDASESAKRLK